MKRPDPSKAEPVRAETQLARMHPNVVVRRRVVDAPTIPKAHASDASDDDENGPPSSVNVARALASLRGDELTRLEQIMSDDEDAEPVVFEPAPPPSVPTLRVGATVAVTELARLLGVAPQELVTACVTHGFFSVTVKSVLPRETARAAATLFGWKTEDDDDDIEAAPRATRPKPAAAKSTAAKPKAAKKKSAAAKKR